MGGISSCISYCGFVFTFNDLCIKKNINFEETSLKVYGAFIAYFHSVEPKRCGVISQSCLGLSSYAITVNMALCILFILLLKFS